jgi:ATP-dependent DNA ligase
MKLAISKIEKLDMMADRYDIQVEDNENFFANGILVHNCRTIAVVKKNEVNYYNRSGKEESTINGLFDAELFRIRDLLDYDFVLDGERYASNFTETMNAKKDGNDAAKAALKFRAFFLMPLSDWIAQSTRITMRHARFHLDTILEMIEAEKIVLSEGREVTDYADMMKFCNEAIDDHGVEGLILKDWEAVYTWDRTFAWTKVKRFYDVDCRVVTTYPGRKGTRLEGKMGGLTVVGFLESGERVEANVGSGFSDEDRALTDWVGQTIVVKYQEVSRAKNKTVASLRFPTYERRRDDKTVEL